MGVMERYNKKKKEKSSEQTPAKIGVQDRYNWAVKNGGQFEVTEDSINSFIEDANTYLSSVEEEYNSLGWGNASDAYRARSATASDLGFRSSMIRRWLDSRKGRVDEDTYKSLTSTLDGIDSSLSQVTSGFKSAMDFYSRYETEDAYNEALRQREEYESYFTADLDSVQTEIDGYKARLAEAAPLYEERRSLMASIRNAENRPNGKNSSTYKEATARVKEIDALLGTIGNPDTLRASIAEKETFLTNARRHREWQALAGVADPESEYYDPEFEEKSGYVSTETDSWWGRLWSDKGLGYADSTYEYINNQNGFRDRYNDKSHIYERSMSGVTLLQAEGYDYMHEDEVALYNYYYATGGKEAAEEYLNSIQETLNYRHAQGKFAELDGKWGLEMLFGVEAGLDQFKTGMEGLLNFTDDYIPTSAPQFTSQMVREDLGDSGFKILGSSVGQITYDAITTTSNMLPSILASTAVNVVAPGAGSAVGAVLLGASASGNAYAEMLNLGYNKGQARTYSALVGASETGLQYLLGGVDSLAGGPITKFTTKHLSKIDNAFARVAITIGTDMLHEGFEEGLQTVLESWFKSIATGVDFESPDFEEVLYSSLLGAISAAGLGGVTTSIGEVGANIQAKDTYGKMQGDLVGEASVLEGLPSDLAKRYQSRLDKGKNLTGQQLRTLVGATEKAHRTNDTALIASAAEARLTELGETGDVKALAEIIAKQVAGEKLSLSEKAILKNSKRGNRVVNELNAENIRTGATTSEWAKGIGTKRINADVYSLAAEVAGATPAVTSDTDAADDDELEVAAERVFEASEDGRTIYNGEEVTIAGIAEVKDGDVKLRLESGETVSAKDVSFGSEGEALVYEMVAREGYGVETANEIIGAYNAHTATPAATFVADATLAYRYGRAGIESGLSELSIPEQQARIVYNRGRYDAEADAEQRTKAPTARTGKPSAKSKKNGIIYEGFKYSEKSATDVQKVSIIYYEGLAKLFPTLEFHAYRSEIENGMRVAYIDGHRVENAPNGYFTRGNQVYIDINAGNNGEGVMLYTLSHEITHYIRAWNAKGFKALADFLIKHYGESGVKVTELIAKQTEKVRASLARSGKTLSEGEIFDRAYEEVVADAMSTMLADPKAYEKLAELKKQNATLFQKVGEAIKKVLEKLKSLLGIYSNYTPDSVEAGHVMQFAPEVYEQLQDLYLKAFVEAEALHEGAIGSRSLEDLADAVNEDGETLFQYRAMEADEDTYRQMLMKWGKMSTTQIDNLFATIDRAMELIKDNLEALDYAWDADIDDRAFSPVKPNSDKLYQVSLDFSTLCRKRILQQMVQAQLQEALNKPLTREEGIAIRDALMALQEEGRQIEVACALCYVESARMKSPEQIKRFIENREKVIKEFFAGKSGGSIKAAVKKAEADARARLGVGDAPLKSLPGKVAQEIRDAKKAAKESYKPTAEEQKLIEVAKGMTVSDFTSPEGLERLAKLYPRLFDAYTSYIRNATKSKGIENDTWWRAGDSTAIGDVLIANMNRENGLRTQSWSDFQVIHILDYIASTIELATRNTKAQAYSKVPDYVELMGLTGVMINMSLIPTATFNGSLEYDSVEGIAYKRALELRDKYHATAGTICIGVDNAQIRLLLADGTIDYVIPYHRSGMSKALRKLMHIPKWSDYELYQSESNLSRADAEKQAKKYGVKLLDTSDPNYHKGTSFSEWFDIREAQQIAKMENANPSDKAKQKKYGVMYGGYMAMQNAANNYLRLCAERGIAPKFSHENADFTAEENYWKLLIDRKMVDNVTGEVIEQQTIKPIFSQGEVMRILDDELKRYPSVKADQDYAVRKVTEAYLSGELKGGMSAEAIAKIMKKPVDNVTNVNILASADDTMFSERDPYSYETLTSKTDMELTTVGGAVPGNRADVVVEAKKNAAKVGKVNPKDGSVSVHVDDIDADVVLSTAGLRHGLDRRFDVNAPVTLHIGEILKHSIRINEMTPSKKTATGSYALIGAAKTEDGQLYIVRSVVNQFSNELDSIDVLYAVNAKTEIEDIKKGNQAGDNPQGSPSADGFLTDSAISIAQLLDYVNRYFPDILPESVLRHYGHDARPEGKLGNDALYSERDSAETATQFVTHIKAVLDGRGKWYASDVFSYVAEHPELNFIDRIYAKDKDVKRDLEALLAGIADVKTLEDFSWFMGEAYAQKAPRWGEDGDMVYPYRGAVRTFRNAIKNRINAIMTEKVGGTNLGVKNGDVSLEDIEGLFYRLNSNDEIGEFAKKVFATARTLGVNIRFTNQMIKQPKGVVVSGQAIGDMVRYKTSYFNDTAKTDQAKAQTILHELIHVCTTYVMRANVTAGDVNWSGSSDNYNRIANAATRLNRIYGQVNGDPAFKGQYGLENPREMVAELANERFVDLLKKKSLWQEIVDWICELFGFRRGTSAYDNARMCVDYILDNPEVSEYKKYALAQREAVHRAGHEAFGSTADMQGDVHYSERDSDSISTRSLLANALEGAAQNDVERDALARYKAKIALIEAEQKKLSEIRAEIRELSFAKGPRDTARIKKLQFDENQAANRINTYDRQLLNLQSTEALKRVLEREKKLAYAKAKREGQEALAAYRERSAKTQRELITRYQESRKKAVEGRNKTAMRHKIKDIAHELDTLLRNPTSKKHVKEELRKAVAEALLAINLDTVGAEERVARYDALIAKATDPDLIAELTASRDRIQLQGENLKAKLDALRVAYERIKDSEDIELSMSYQEVIRNSIDAVSKKVGNTSIRDMTLEQLEAVYELYSMIRKTISNANKLFKQGKAEGIMQTAEAVNAEVRKVGGERNRRPQFVANLQRIGWKLLKPLFAFRTIGSDTLTELYTHLQEGEGTFYGDVSAAQEFIKGQYKKHGYKAWDLKKTATFTAKSGKSFKLTLEQMMSLYAYSRREQAHAHIIEGGIVFEDAVVVEKKHGIPIKYEVTTKDAFNISEETLAEIVGHLTAEQRAFVEEMQAYLSDTMGAKGNEVSMELLGVKLFRESFYLPIKSSQYYLNFSTEEAGEIKLKSPAFSRETVQHANNPIVLHGFTDLWAEHVSNMSMYHSFVLALEDFTRVYNYKTRTDALVETMSTKKTIETAYPGATKYISDFLKSLNGGVRMDTVGFAEKLTSLTKKSAVLGSLSVMIQQPSAMMRAMAHINPVHFATSAPKSINLLHHRRDWAELKKYATVAGIKEMGRFDVGMGKDTADWIKANGTAIAKIDDILSFGPAFMDEVTWVSIWNAVKRETLHRHKNLSPNSEEFLKIAGERFTEVISLTQVYDSVFSRSDLMRNKSWIAKALTAFMAEPTTTLNMLWDSWVQGKRTGSVKGFAKVTSRTAGAVLSAIIVNAALKSIVMAMRDDDDDESYAESYVEHIFGDLKDSINPLTLIPVVKDVVSIFNGYDVERMDMALFSDLKNAIDAFDSDTKTEYEKWSGLAGAISSFFGLPLKNVERDIRGLITTIFGDSESTTAAGLLNAVEEGWTGESKSNGQQLYEAMLNGDKEQVKRVEGRFETQGDINNAVRKALRENDPRIKEAAEARLKGNSGEALRLANAIVGEGHFSQADVYAAVKSEYEAMKEDKPSTSTTEKAPNFFAMEDYYNAIVGRDQATAAAVKEEMLRTAVKNGKDREEAEDDFVSSFVGQLREKYEDGELSDRDAKRMLTTYAGKSDEDAEKKVQYWAFKKKYPDYDDLSEEAVTKYYSDVEPAGISIKVYYNYSKQRAKCKGTDSDGDGKTDSGSVKREVLKVIDSLPISAAQKDALYFLNGWAASTLYEAPWR